MRIGINAAQIGRLADPAAIAATARAAEQVGYASLWVLDRRDREALDPLLVLASAAAVTRRIRIGTSVLAAPRYPAAELVRALASLDVLSEGRLTIGLGLGRPAPAGADPLPPGAAEALERILDALDGHWAAATADGAATTTATSGTDLVPRRQQRPPVLLSASTPAGLARVARRADGWNPIGGDPELLQATWAQVRDLAAGYGRDPDRLQLVVRADVQVIERAGNGDRQPFCGTVEQVAADLRSLRAIGAHEAILRARGDVGLDESLDIYARLAEAVGDPDPLLS